MSQPRKMPPFSIIGTSYHLISFTFTLGISGVASSRVQTLLSRYCGNHASRDIQGSLIKSGMWLRGKGWLTLLSSPLSLFWEQKKFSYLSLTIRQVKVSKMTPLVCQECTLGRKISVHVVNLEKTQTNRSVCGKEIKAEWESDCPPCKRVTISAFSSGIEMTAGILNAYFFCRMKSTGQKLVTTHWNVSLWNFQLKQPSGIPPVSLCWTYYFWSA